MKSPPTKDHGHTGRTKLEVTQNHSGIRPHLWRSLGEGLYRKCPGPRSAGTAPRGKGAPLRRWHLRPHAFQDDSVHIWRGQGGLLSDRGHRVASQKGTGLPTRA